jgi:ABC-type transporter Mla MlaB component
LADPERDLLALCERARILVHTTHRVVECDVAAVARPDLGTVDALARLALMARRLDRGVTLLRASAELRQLLSLVGLGEIVPCVGWSALEPQWQPEQRKESGGVQEERDSADLAG